jgi:hypothetical protein
MKPAPGAETIAPPSPASRPSPPGDLRPALTPAAGGTYQHQSGAARKEDQTSKIHLTEVSTIWGDCRMSVKAGQAQGVTAGAAVSSYKV